jgi:Zn-dependent protease/predicted transcriptional regulator
VEHGKDIAMASSLNLPGIAPVSSHSPAASPHRSGWSWRIGRPFGIEVRVHATFLILLGWVAASHLMQGHDVRVAASGVAYVVAVFAIVVLHEFGHALTARRFGITTRDITLLPIGGVARLERMPSKPSQELLVALAGPAVNVGLALLSFAGLLAMGALADATHLTLVGGPFLAKLMWTNVGLAVFNLIPAFPMDGGRVLRAALAMRSDPVRATDIAATVGQGIALVFGLLGLFTNPFLVFVAFFVWVGAQEEARLTHVHASLAGVPVSRAMVRRLTVASPDESVASAAERMIAGFQDDLPVVVGSRLVGIVGRDDVLRATLGSHPDVPVSSVMRRELSSVSEDESLDAAVEKLRQSGRRSIPVVSGDVLVGVLPIENVAYVLHVRERERSRLARA